MVGTVVEKGDRTEIAITIDTEFSIAGALGDFDRHKPIVEPVECRVGERGFVEVGRLGRRQGGTTRQEQIAEEEGFHPGLGLGHQR